MYKTCIKCNLTKDVSEFNKHRHMKDGYKNICKSCDKEYFINYNKNLKSDPDYYNKKVLLSRLDKVTKLDMKYTNLYPEKSAAHSYAHIHKPKLPEGYLYHHWSYNKKDFNSLIVMTYSQHMQAHKYIIYDQEQAKFRTTDFILLQTIDEHLNYINQYVTPKIEMP